MNKLLIFLLALVFAACSTKGCTRMNKEWQMSDRTYIVKQYSGGKLIGEYKFEGILNDSEGSDGYYFFKGDSLIEVSGDLIIKSVD